MICRFIILRILLCPPLHIYMKLVDLTVNSTLIQTVTHWVIIVHMYPNLNTNLEAAAIFLLLHDIKALKNSTYIWVYGRIPFQ